VASVDQFSGKSLLETEPFRREIEIPADLGPEINELLHWPGQAQTDPSVHHRKVARIEGLADRVSKEKYPLLWAALRHDLGLSYAGLSGADAGQNLPQAIACYQEALGALTPDTTPLCYAQVQHDLGEASMHDPEQPGYRVHGPG